MLAGPLDEWRLENGGIVQRAAASRKLAGAGLLLVAAAVIPPLSWPMLALYALTVALIIRLSRVPVVLLLRRLALLMPFVLGVCVLALFQDNGPEKALFLTLKCAFSITVVILLGATTSFAEILRILRRAGAPALLITTISLMYRYLFVLLDEALRMQRAQRARSYSLNRRSAWKRLPPLIGLLFSRTSERGERIYGAMRARGWR